MSAREKNETLAELVLWLSKTGVIFYVIPPTKKEGEVGQRRLDGCLSLALLWSNTRELLRLTWQQLEF